VFDMVPDTNTVFTQPLESSFDAHRWQQFGVLPDRWKDAAFGGQNMACMLYVDLNDRRGDERVWVSVADSTGATAVAKYGAHNGWHAPAGPPGTVNNPAYFVAAHGGQPGTTWDMYGVKASESLTTSAGALGGRLAYRDPSPANLVHNKYARMAPTVEMLEAYYPMMVILTGDLNSGVWGPFDDRSQDDHATVQAFLALGTDLAPRGIYIAGDGFAESEFGYPTLTDFLGMDLLWPVYRQLSGNLSLNSDLIVNPAIHPDDIYGVRNGCTYTLDVLAVNPAVTEAQVGTEYTPSGATQYISGVYKPAAPGRPWVAMTEGFDIFNVTGRFDGSTRGRLAYYFNMFGSLFGDVCTFSTSPTTGIDTPNNAQFVNFAKLAGNPVENRQATILFGLAKNDRVQVRIFDVTGRLVRTLSDRLFEAGNHRLVWDGVDDHGHSVARGVYFAKINFVNQGFQSANKMVVLN
jgi:hypothetical protein